MKKEDEILLAHIKATYENAEQKHLSKFPNRLAALAAKQSETEVRAETALILADILSEKNADLTLLAVKGKSFTHGGRQEGALADTTKYIISLAKNNPKLSAKVLYGKADKNIIGKMAEGTFSNHVSAARNSKS